MISKPRKFFEKVLDKQGGFVAQYEYTLGAAGEQTKVKELNRTETLLNLPEDTLTHHFYPDQDNIFGQDFLFHCKHYIFLLQM